LNSLTELKNPLGYGGIFQHKTSKPSPQAKPVVIPPVFALGNCYNMGYENGTVTIFCPSSTSALTTVEYEPGLVQDLRRLFDEIIPADRPYAHDAAWGDGNGHSHVRASLLGPSLTVPFVGSRLTLGTWQQIIYLDFDNRSRHRNLVVQIIGE
jgi:secondary thiamine-phosphate synthase enzyme